MALNPPLCLEVYYITAGGADTPNPNLYHFTFNVTPQVYLGGQYDGTSLRVGMYTTNNFDGYVFKIYSIINQSATQVELYLEDIDGYNAIIDPSGGIAGGGPLNQSPGYVFQLNSQGIPVLTAVDTAPSITFTDSILARFLYFSSGSSGSGVTGATGATGPPGPSGVIKSLPSISYYLSNEIVVNTNEVVPVIYNTLDEENSSGSTSFTYDSITGILMNPTSETVTVLISGQLQTDNDTIDMTKNQPCIFIVKNTNKVVSSSVLNFQGSSFSAAIILDTNDKITILFGQYFSSAIRILQGQFTTRITYTQLDNVQGPTGATGPAAVIKSLPSISYYISNSIPAPTNENVVVIYNTFDSYNSSGSTDFTYNTTSGILKNPTNETLTVLISGQLQTDNDTIDMTKNQPCIFVVKNTDNIVSSSTLNFQGSSFSTAIILEPNDQVTIIFKQYFDNTINILDGRFITRITYTQLDNVQGPTGATGPSAVMKSLPSISYYISNDIPSATEQLVTVIYDTYDSENSSGSTDFTYDPMLGILTNPTSDTITVLVSGQLQTDNDILDISKSQPCIYVVKNTNNIVSSSTLNFQGISFSTAIILEPMDQVSILFRQYFSDTINILKGQFTTRITYTQLDTVQGPTGATGSPGATGPRGQVIYVAISFDGGSSSSAYPFGPAFDCGTST